MSKKQVVEIIRKYKPVLQKKFKVKKIGVFGSVARGDFSQNSDIDILVSFYEPIGWEFIDLKDYLSDKLGKEVDLVTEQALRPAIKADILNELCYL